MGRLENFIPQLKKGSLRESSGQSVLQNEQGRRLPLSPFTTSFAKQINGHLSLREIFLFLNSKGESFSMSQCLDLLSQMAEQGILANEEDYYKLNSHPETPTTPIKRSPDYFSQERLIGLIQKTTLFLQCDRQAAMKLLGKSELVCVSKGTQLIQQGSRSRHFFVLLSGEVGVYRTGECLAFLGSLSVFGESAAIFNQVRNADVLATQESWLLKVDASDLVNTSSPESFDVFKGLRSRLILNQVLSANPLFRKVPTDIMQLFISKCRIEKWGKEQTVLEQDESSGDFYFILQGSVSVIKDGMPVTSLADGDHFGEVAALFNLPRIATVVTESPCTFLVLNQKPLFEVLCSHFRLALDIEAIAEQRRQATGNLLQLFDEVSLPEISSPEADEFTSSSSFIFDQELLEASQSHFDLEVVDLSNPGADEAS